MKPDESMDTADGREPRADLPWRDESTSPFQFNIRSLLLFTALVGAVLGCIVNLPAMLSWAYQRWEVGQQFDQRTFEESRFVLRITAFHERGTIMAAPGAFYRYEVKTASDRRWRGIAMFRLQKEKIPDDHLRRVTDSCAYFFHGCIFGITTDGGTSWSIKGGTDHPPIFPTQTDPYATIESVTISPDGVGTMQVSKFDYVQWKQLPSQKLVTVDVGQTWTAP
jgi:hypothetical protein